MTNGIYYPCLKWWSATSLCTPSGEIPEKSLKEYVPRIVPSIVLTWLYLDKNGDSISRYIIEGTLHESMHCATRHGPLKSDRPLFVVR